MSKRPPCLCLSHALGPKVITLLMATVAVVFSITATETNAAQPPAPKVGAPVEPFLRVGQGHVKQVAALGLLDGGRTLLTSAMDDTLRLWNLDSGKLTSEITAPHSRPKSVVVSPDGKSLALLTPDGKLQVLELPSGKVV